MTHAEPIELARELAKKLGHRFATETFLTDALTHRSIVHERADLAPRDNERLEFLGDSIMGLAAAELLFRHFPTAREGELTRRRADLVCERTLAHIAKKLDVGPALRLGRGEEKSHGRTKPRLLASALEALVAAVCLDAGFESALDVARGILEPLLTELSPGHFDFKSRVQEVLQARGERSPRYEVVDAEGPEHARIFHVAIVGERGELGRGSGRSKLEAEQDAARAALEAEEIRVEPCPSDPSP